ncbi:MAG TPA: oligosaccharide flippase family protein [Polyangiaceae bacterium]|nr:oligosaccharide flippase family protein [Polyangiaceae bacterium]
MTASGQERAQQAGVLIFGKIVSTLGEAVVPIIMIRLLSKAEVGVLSTVMMLYATLALVLTSAFPATLMYFLPAREAPERRALAVRMSLLMLLLGGVLSVLMFALGFVGLSLGGASLAADHAERSLLDPKALFYLLALAPYPLGDLPSRLLPNLLVIEGRARAAATIGVMKAVGAAVATLIPIALGLPLHVVVGVTSLFGLAYSSLVPYYLRVLYRGVPKVPAPVSSREIIRFTMPLGITDVVGRLNSELDRYLIAASFPVTRVAEYRAAAWQVPLIKEIPYTVGRVDTPYLTRLFESGKAREAIGLWRASTEKVALLVVPLASIFVIAAEQVMVLLFTEEYVGAASIFRLYSLLMLGRACSFGNVLLAAGKPGYIFRGALLAFLTNIMLSVTALMAFGFVGPALGTLVAFVATTFYYCWLIAKAADIRLSETFPLVAYARIVFTAAVASIPGLLIKLNGGLGPGLSLLAVTTTLLATFAVLGTLTGQIERDDWRFLGRWFTGGFARA